MDEPHLGHPPKLVPPDAPQGDSVHPVVHPLNSRTRRVRTGHGYIYVTLSGQGASSRLFVHYSGIDPCSKALSEALCLAIVRGLRAGIPLQDYIKDLRGNSCGHPAHDDKRLIVSIPDGISQSLDAMMDSQL